MFLGHDQLKTAFVIHASINLQSNVQSITKIPNFSHDNVVQRTFREEELIRNRGDQGVIPSSTALVSQATRCKRVSHVAPAGRKDGTAS